MLQTLQKVNGIVWGGPTLYLILGMGIYIGIRTGFIQFRWLPKAIKQFVQRIGGSEKRTGIQELCTALAATVGTGNLAGVAGAIAIGGPGAVFWLWISAFGGMALKFSEATLSVRYREKNADGESVGGPMYMIKNGMGIGWRRMAYIYSFLGVFAAFGVGNATQVNTLIGSVNGVLEGWGGRQTDGGNILMGIGFAALLAIVLFGGAGRIGRAAEKLVPFAAILYIFLCTAVLFLRSDRIPGAFGAIVKGAFSPQALTGGVVGSALLTLRIGVSRGTFTNEAGMGTAGIAHAASDVRHPVEQGLMGIVEVFLDTVVICTLTALVILCSGVEIPYGFDCGINLTCNAFSSVLGNWSEIAITVSVCLFAFATILGWGLYGARCAQFLLGENAWRYFAALQIVIVIVGAALKTELIWTAAEIVNGLMAIPCLIAVFALTPELLRLIREYKQLY